MAKFGDCPYCGKQVKTKNLRAISRQNQTYGFKLALNGIRQSWGILINNFAVDLQLTNEQVQKIMCIGDAYWEMVGQFAREDMTPDEFAEYIVERSKEREQAIREQVRDS